MMFRSCSRVDMGNECMLDRNANAICYRTCSRDLCNTHQITFTLPSRASGPLQESLSSNRVASALTILCWCVTTYLFEAESSLTSRLLTFYIIFYINVYNFFEVNFLFSVNDFALYVLVPLLSNKSHAKKILCPVIAKLSGLWSHSCNFISKYTKIVGRKNSALFYTGRL